MSIKYSNLYTKNLFPNGNTNNKNRTSQFSNCHSSWKTCNKYNVIALKLSHFDDKIKIYLTSCYYSVTAYFIFMNENKCSF